VNRPEPARRSSRVTRRRRLTKTMEGRRSRRMDLLRFLCISSWSSYLRGLRESPWAVSLVAVVRSRSSQAKNSRSPSTVFVDIPIPLSPGAHEQHVGPQQTFRCSRWLRRADECAPDSTLDLRQRRTVGQSCFLQESVRVARAIDACRYLEPSVTVLPQPYSFAMSGNARRETLLCKTKFS
jgi:hypothetical protein